jgi:hypothetical protein
MDSHLAMVPPNRSVAPAAPESTGRASDRAALRITAPFALCMDLYRTIS